MAILGSTKRTPMSREGFDRLPEGPPFYDHVNGEAVEVNRAGIRHQQVVVALAFTLTRHAQQNQVRGRRRGDAGGDVFGPDMSFVSEAHRSIVDDEKGDIYGAPDLVVEEYQWPPRGCLLVDATAASHHFTPHVFPGLEIRLADLVQ